MDARRPLAAVFVLATLVVAIAAGAAFALTPAWTDYPSNPAFDPPHQAYYPDVLYSATSFDGHGASYHYKMWYDDGTNTWLTYSNDGKAWTRFGTAAVVSGGLRHPQVAYDAGAFGNAAGDLIQASFPETYAVTPYYKMWLWEAANGRRVRLAYSDDGETWQVNYPRDVLPHEIFPLNPGTDVYDLEVLYDPAAPTEDRYRGWADNNGRFFNAHSSDGATWSLITTAPALDWGGPSTIAYFSAYKPTGQFERSSAPMTAGVCTQERVGDKVGMHITSTPSYADSGFYYYRGPLSGIGAFTVTGTGDQFSLNLWFDRNGNGEYFNWTGDLYTGSGTDAYIYSPSSVGGTLNISDATLFTSLQGSPGGGNYTLAQLKAGVAPNITGSTQVAIWIGINTGSGSKHATVTVPADPRLWDSGSLSRMSVARVSPTEWHAWFGGATGNGGNQGVGHATSSDGIAWTKDPSNPIASLGGSGTFGGLGAPGTWNDARNYAMSVIYSASGFDGNGERTYFKMWRSGESTLDTGKTIGYAYTDLLPEPAGASSLTCSTSTTLTADGGGVWVWGSLYDEGGHVISSPGRTVSLEASSSGAGWSTIGTMTYDDFTRSYRLRGTVTKPGTEFRLVFAGDAQYAASMSPVRLVGTPYVPPVTTTLRRVAGADRYETAANLATDSYGYNLTGVHDVIIACGEEARMVDSLTAAGLAHSYNAPILLVRSTLPPSKLGITGAILARMQGPINIHVIGGTVAVPANVYNELAKYRKGGIIERFGGRNRYHTAQLISDRMRARNGLPAVVLVANGSNPTGWYDALALSAIARADGYPIMPIATGGIPGETAAALAASGPAVRWAGGNAASIPAITLAAAGVDESRRMAGADRFGTAADIADTAVAQGWLTNDNVLIANTISDAMTGGSHTGRVRGPLLYTDAASLPPVTAAYLSDNRAAIANAVVAGGTKPVPDAIYNLIKAALGIAP